GAAGAWVVGRPVRGLVVVVVDLRALWVEHGGLGRRPLLGEVALAAVEVAVVTGRLLAGDEVGCNGRGVPVDLVEVVVGVVVEPVRRPRLGAGDGDAGRTEGVLPLGLVVGRGNQVEVLGEVAGGDPLREPVLVGGRLCHRPREQQIGPGDNAGDAFALELGGD